MKNASAATTWGSRSLSRCSSFAETWPWPELEEKSQVLPYQLYQRMLLPQISALLVPVCEWAAELKISLPGMGRYSVCVCLCRSVCLSVCVCVSVGVVCVLLLLLLAVAGVVANPKP